jgi:hypothetical protein
LGARCNDVEFSNGYPELDTNLGELDCDLFPQGYTDWNAVYLEGLDSVWGSFAVDDESSGQSSTSLPFIGTVENDSIVMVGLNLTCFYSLTQDSTVASLLE